MLMLPSSSLSQEFEVMFNTSHVVFLVAVCFMDVCTAGDVKLTMPKVALSGYVSLFS